MYVAKQRAPRLLAYLPMPEKSERPVLLSCQRWPCCAPWSPRAGRSLPRRFPLPAPFWARLPVSRAQKKSSLRSKHRKKNLPVFRWCLDAVPVPVPACGLCMPQKNERPSGSPTYLCRKKTSAFGLLALSPEKKNASLIDGHAHPYHYPLAAQWRNGQWADPMLAHAGRQPCD